MATYDGNSTGLAQEQYTVGPWSKVLEVHEPPSGPTLTVVVPVLQKEPWRPMPIRVLGTLIPLRKMTKNAPEATLDTRSATVSAHLAQTPSSGMEGNPSVQKDYQAF